MSKPTAHVHEVCFSHDRADSTSEAPLFDRFSVCFEPGATAILGESGAGKSTLARLLAGQLTPSAGTVNWHFDGGRRPRDVNYMDQTPMNSVFPWQRVLRNIEYPLLKLHWSKADAKRRAMQLLDLFRLTHVAAAYPAHISGGELQRTAIARCVSWSPRALILDESLSALDAATKAVVATALRRLVIDEGVTLILITHNIGDVEMIADRLISLGGRPVRVTEDRPVVRTTSRLDEVYSPASPAVQGAEHEAV